MYIDETDVAAVSNIAFPKFGHAQQRNLVDSNAEVITWRHPDTVRFLVYLPRPTSIQFQNLDLHIGIAPSQNNKLLIYWWTIQIESWCGEVMKWLEV